MPCRVNVNPSPDNLPIDWERPDTPTPEKCFILHYDYKLSNADSAYWGGYNQLTSSRLPKCWKQNGNVKKLMASRGISPDVVKIETEESIEWALADLWKQLENNKDMMERLSILDRYAKYLELRCKVGGVPLHHTVVTGGKDKEGSDRPIIIRIEQGCGE